MQKKWVVLVIIALVLGFVIPKLYTGVYIPLKVNIGNGVQTALDLWQSTREKPKIIASPK